MYSCSQDFLTALKNPIKQSFIKLEFYTSDMSLITTFETDTSNLTSQNKAGVNTTNSNTISVDNTRSVRRSFSFAIVNNPNGLSFNWGTDSPVWISNRVKLYTGLMLANRTIEYIPQGVYIITAPYDTNDDKNANSVFITGQDKSYLFTSTRGKFGYETTYAKGLDVKTAIMQIAQTAGETMFNFDDINVTLPYDITFSPTDNKWDAMTQFASTIAQCDLFYDVNGYLRLQKTVTDYSKEPPVWTYNFSDPTEKFYGGNQRSFDETNLANHIQVIGGSSQTPTVFFEIIVDETKPYDMFFDLAQQSDFQTGTYSGVMDIPLNTELNNDPNNLSIGGIQLAKVGTDLNQNDITQADFEVYTSWNNMQAVDDTNTLSLPVIEQGYLALAGFRQDWLDGVINNQTLYGTGATQSPSETLAQITLNDGSSVPANPVTNPEYYTLTSPSGYQAKSQLNNGESVQDGVYACNLIVPSSGECGILYRTTEWDNNNDTYGYYVGVTASGSLVFGHGTNASAGSFTLLHSVDLSNTSATPCLSSGSLHNIQAIVSGSTHTIYVDQIQEIQITDSTFPSSGSFGLITKGTSGEFQSFGYFPDPSSPTMTGYRINQYDLTNVTTAGTSSVQWVDNIPSTNQTIVVDYSLSTDGGTTWGSWTTLNNGDSLSSKITIGQNTNNWKLQLRETFTTVDATQSPQISQITTFVQSEFVSSGTYTSKILQITDGAYSPIANSGIISWTDYVATGGTLAMQLNISVDGGNTWSGWQSVTNGQVVSQITPSVLLQNVFYQIQATLSTTDPTDSPQLVSVKNEAQSYIWAGNPYSIQKIGDILYQHNNGSPDPLITTDYQAQWRAKYELMHRLGHIEQVNANLAPIWIHDANDIVEVEDSVNGVTGNYMIQSFQLPLIPALVQTVLVKTDNFITDWQAI